MGGKVPVEVTVGVKEGVSVPVGVKVAVSAGGQVWVEVGVKVKVGVAVKEGLMATIVCRGLSKLAEDGEVALQDIFIKAALSPKHPNSKIVKNFFMPSPSLFSKSLKSDSGSQDEIQTASPITGRAPIGR